MKINGVCLHHDLGALGSAFNVSAAERQLRLMKEMGVNAVRCSHNPLAPELLDLCDRMGLLVMDEPFDMWWQRKTERDYARFFDEWHERDLRDHVMRDRDHASIFMWSIGNEVLEQWSNASADTLSLAEANFILNFGQDRSKLAALGETSVNSLLASKLAGIVRELDPTRPITSGCNEPDPGNHIFRSGVLDVIGYNYHDGWFSSVPANFPGKPFVVSESVSSLMTRGWYRMPSDSVRVCPPLWDDPAREPSFACSSYDNYHVPWGCTHEKSLHDVLHLFPHWNWNEGETVDVWAYYNNADCVELFLNGRSLGERRKLTFEEAESGRCPETCGESHPSSVFGSQTAWRSMSGVTDGSTEFHVRWRIPFEPGELKAVAKKDGRAVRETVVRTAGEPASLRLIPDRTSVSADGSELCFVSVEVLDKDGSLCPKADNLIRFEVSGPAEIAGVDNGSPISLERFKSDRRHAMYGKALVILRPAVGKAGKVTLRAVSDNGSDRTMSAETIIKVR